MSFIKNMKIRNRLIWAFSIPSIIFASVYYYAAVSANAYDQQVFDSGLKTLVSVADASVEKYIIAMDAGEISKDEAKKLALARIHELQYNQNRYYFVLDTRGTVLSHPSPGLMGKPIPSENLLAWVDEINKNGSAITEYIWQGSNKITYGKVIPEFGWIIGTGTNPDPHRTHISSTYYTMIEVSILVTFIILVLSIYIANTIIRPILHINRTLDDVCKGSLTARCTNLDKSELGELGNRVNATIQSLRTGMTELKKGTNRLDGNVQYLGELANGCQSAYDEHYTQINQVTTAITEMAESVQDVATTIAAEEITAKLDEAVARDSGIGKDATAVNDAVEELRTAVSDLSNALNKYKV